MNRVAVLAVRVFAFAAAVWVLFTAAATLNGVWLAAGSVAACTLVHLAAGVDPGD